MTDSLFTSKDSRRVEILWVYHDAGYYWECPMCPSRRKVAWVLGFGSWSSLEAKMVCGKCGASFERIPGDVDASNNLCIRHGYLFLGDAPNMPTGPNDVEKRELAELARLKAKYPEQG